MFGRKERELIAKSAEATKNWHVKANRALMEIGEPDCTYAVRWIDGRWHAQKCEPEISNRNDCPWGEPVAALVWRDIGPTGPSMANHFFPVALGFATFEEAQHWVAMTASNSTHYYDKDGNPIESADVAKPSDS